MLGSVNYSTQVMSGMPDQQVSQAIAQMSRYAIADASRPEVLEDAEHGAKLAGGDPVKGAWLQARNKLRFVQDSSVVNNADVVEVFIRPVDVSLMSRSLGCVTGDCDDFSMYVAALLLAQQIPCCFATVAVDPEQPDAYSHVYVVAYPQGQRIAVDASHGKFCGWEAPNYFGRLREWDLFEASKLRMRQSSAVLGFLFAGLLGWWYFNKYGFGGGAHD